MLSFFAITCIFFIRYKKERHPRIIRVDTKNRNPVQRKDADFCYGCQTSSVDQRVRAGHPGQFPDLHHLLYADGHHCFRGHPFPECFRQRSGPGFRAVRAGDPGGPSVRRPLGGTVRPEEDAVCRYFVLPGDHLYVLPGGLPAHDVRGAAAERGGLRHCLHRHQHHRVRHDPCRTPGRGHQLLCPEHEPGCSHRTVHRHAPAADVPLQRDHPVLHRHGADLPGRCFRDESG